MLLVSKRKIQRNFTNYTTLKRTTQAYITNIIVDEVVIFIFFLKVHLTPKYFFRLNRSLHVFETHCTFLNLILTFYRL